MATIDKNSIEKVRKLYCDNQYSVNDVAKKLGVSIDAVFYCMRKNGIERRKNNETNAIKYCKAKPSFNLKKINSEKLRILKVIGVMLYWGEGGKADTICGIDFANSDQDMIIMFLKFLRQICGVDENRLRVYSYFYSKQNSDKNISYWSKLTKISKSQFTKPYIRKDFREDKKDKMPHGLIHVRYSDKKLLNLVKVWIEEYKNI
jgi:hypothetical protein